MADLGCWIFSKRRWERIHNLLAASSAPLSKKIQTVTFTMEELELHTCDDFAVVPWEKSSTSISFYGETDHEYHQYIYEKQIVLQEHAALEEYGVADMTLMLDVLRLIKVHGCWIRLDLSPSDPLRRKIPPINRRAREVHTNLQRAIAQVRPKIDRISIDRLRHRDMVDVLADCDDNVFESYTSLSEIRLAPCKNDGLTGSKNKRCTYQVLEAMFTSAQHLQRMHIHTPRAYQKEGYLLWAPNLLRHNRLSYLQQMALLDVPLSPDDLLHLLRRCASTLRYLTLAPEVPDSSEVRMSVLKQLLTMQKLDTIDLKLPGMQRLEYMIGEKLKNGLSILLEAEMEVE